MPVPQSYKLLNPRSLVAGVGEVAIKVQIFAVRNGAAPRTAARQPARR